MDEVVLLWVELGTMAFSPLFACEVNTLEGSAVLLRAYSVSKDINIVNESYYARSESRVLVYVE